MTRIAFAKVEGLGNDFVLVDERARTEPSLSVAARRALCDRHRGVGADGVLTLLAPQSPGALATMHLTNADGSVAEMCGNGLRCTSLWLVRHGVVAAGKEHVIDTGAGARGASVKLDAGGAEVRVDMGPARFGVPGQVPRMVREEIEVGGDKVVATAVSMGNPHVVLETEPDIAHAEKLGPLLEHDARFPQRTNVELAAMRPDGSIDVAVWERGVGITRACGTGACAVVASLAHAGLAPTDVDVRVRLPGGALLVRVPSGEGSVWMTGPARVVFDGAVDV